MKSENKTSAYGGVGFSGLLTVAFVVLKLIGRIDWPWWWVVSPIWISILAYAVIVIWVAIVLTWVGKNDL